MTKAEQRAGALRDFVDRHPDGWRHSEWEHLVGDLRGRGLLADGQEESVGKELEKMRVRKTLEELSVPGLGPKRRETVASAYGHMWDLRNATAEDLAALPGLNRRIATDLISALH
jgi:hypothetical protein